MLPKEHVGLNADWNCRAWALPGGIFILDNEDGTFALVGRRVSLWDGCYEITTVIHEMPEDLATRLYALATEQA
jgi:hypothetical protein